MIRLVSETATPPARSRHLSRAATLLRMAHASLGRERGNADISQLGIADLMLIVEGCVEEAEQMGGAGASD